MGLLYRHHTQAEMPGILATLTFMSLSRISCHTMYDLPAAAAKSRTLRSKTSSKPDMASIAGDCSFIQRNISGLFCKSRFSAIKSFSRHGRDYACLIEFPTSCTDCKSASNGLADKQDCLWTLLFWYVLALGKHIASRFTKDTCNEYAMRL